MVVGSDPLVLLQVYTYFYKRTWVLGLPFSLLSSRNRKTEYVTSKVWSLGEASWLSWLSFML